MSIESIFESIKSGNLITKQEAMTLTLYPTNDLCHYANLICKHFCKNEFDLCSITNGKSGKCSEDCKYCAQSVHNHTNIECYSLRNNSSLQRDGLYNNAKGVARFSIVTSGRSLSDAEIENLSKTYGSLKRLSKLGLCASHGLLSKSQLQMLKNSGVTRYHNNLETSRKFFPSICTTHSYDEKISTIKDAQNIGLEVCSGGIFGLGENYEDRIDLALTLRSLNIKSVPINFLNPIEGTPLAHLKPLSEDEIKKSVAIMRFILPDAFLRLAGGRGLLPNLGHDLFECGINASLTGDLLTTPGISIDCDLEKIKSLNLEVKRYD